MKINKKSPNNNDMMEANERLFSVFYLQTGALLRRCSSVVKSSETGVIPEQVNLLVRGIIRLQRCGEKVRRDRPHATTDVISPKLAKHIRLGIPR